MSCTCAGGKGCCKCEEILQSIRSTFIDGQRRRKIAEKDGLAGAVKENLIDTGIRIFKDYTPCPESCECKNRKTLQMAKELMLYFDKEAEGELVSRTTQNNIFFMLENLLGLAQAEDESTKMVLNPKTGEMKELRPETEIG